MAVCDMMYESIDNYHISVSNNKLSHVCHIKRLSIVFTTNNITPSTKGKKDKVRPYWFIRPNLTIDSKENSIL